MTLLVHAKAVEGSRESYPDLLEGVVIVLVGVINECTPFCKISNENGVERTFPVHTPRRKIEVVRYVVKYVVK